jgi:RimJ/RimL family protein N-acetyltransferase
MNVTPVFTANLRLVPRTREQTRAAIAQLPPEQRAQVAPAWLARLEASEAVDPWIHGFAMVHRETEDVVGQCGYKGPPGSDGMVEIAYAVEPEHQGKGYATEAAAALTEFAFRNAEVRVVRAHTRPEQNASTRVLTKCGFNCLGDLMDPEDGLVWRWERAG